MKHLQQPPRCIARDFYLLTLMLVAAAAISACSFQAAEPPTPTASQEFVFGLILVGPKDDRGWSEAHYNGGLFVEENVLNSRMIFIDKLNPNDRPETTLEEAVDDMVAQGAQLIFITSEDFAADTLVVAEKYPDVVFIHITGDHVLKGEAPPNLGNLMGKMEFGKMIAGCAAALTTQTGTLGYVGPLINYETRRLVNSAYLGARYCYENYRGLDPDQLRFLVEWIGFWFYIPGVTKDPIEVTNAMLDGGVDVILSGLDTNEALTTAAERANNGETVWAIPYDYEDACADAPDICLGVPYFNWGPSYLRLAQEVKFDNWEQSWDWVAPYWPDINDVGSTAIGFRKGPGLSAENAATLDQFIAGLASGSIDLFQGPITLQDGSLLVPNGQTATDEQIWYMPQLLAGMEGISE